MPSLNNNTAAIPVYEVERGGSAALAMVSVVAIARSDVAN